MNSRAYRATRVNDVKWDEIARGREGFGSYAGSGRGQAFLMGGLSLGRWLFRAPVAYRQPNGDSQLGLAHQADERGPEAGGSDGVVGDVWRLVTSSVGRLRDQGGAGGQQGVTRLCRGVRRGALAT